MAVEAEVAKVVARIRADVPPDSWTPWPGGYPGEIEAAVIDSVFSVRARYGSPTTGVRAVVGRWREHRGGKLNDLRELARFADKGEGLAEILGNRQKISGGLKALAAARAAKALVDISVVTAADVTGDAAEEAAWCSVSGLSYVTWSYVVMLLGGDGVKADTMIRRFVDRAIERTSTAPEARDLVLAAAAKLKVKPTDLDHAIWSFQRRR